MKYRTPLQWAPALLLLLAAACVPAVTPTARPPVTGGAATATLAPAAPAATATPVRTSAPPEATARPTLAPPETAATPTTAPSPSALQAASLQQEILLAGAPAFALSFVCDALPAPAGPAVRWQQSDQAGMLCLYGFAEGEEVRYEVYDSDLFPVDRGVAVPDTLDSPQPAARVYLTVEPYPAGAWLLRASSASAQLEEMFEVTPVPGPARVVVVLTVGEAAEQAGRTADTLQQGDEVFVRGVHLPPDADIPVGVYFAAEESFTQTRMRLHEQAVMPADAAGTLSAQVTLDPSYGPGFYCVVVQAAEGYEPAREPGELGASACFTVVG